MSDASVTGEKHGLRTVDRRGLLVGGLALLSGIQAGSGAETAGLKTFAAAKGVRFGGAVQARDLAASAAYAGLVAQECAVITAENDMKWPALQPEPDRRTPEAADRIVAFARAHGLAVRGHTLVWGQDGRMPKWFEAMARSGGPAGARALEAQMVAHIRDLAGRYREAIVSWDVVNETLEARDGRGDGLRRSVLLDVFGPSWIDVAFRTARDAAPDATLVYNDYGTEQAKPWKVQKRTMVLRFLEALKSRGVPVQAFGVQAHLAGDEAFDARSFATFLREIASLGLAIEVTELDVDDHTWPADIGERDRRGAELIERFLDVCLAERATTTVVTWGLGDALSYQNRPGWRKVRSDGSTAPARPLPFDAEWRRKPMWHAMARAFQNAPAR